jgi:parallel beta-helix repeat protein
MNGWRRRDVIRLALSLAGAAVLGGGSLPAAEPAAPPAGAEVRVGIDAGDLRGADHRALQAAVDYVAGLGGGTVHVGPGRYAMRNALTLRDNVRVVGVPGQTVFVACDGCSTPLAADGDCNQREITVADPARFRVGDGVAVLDKRAGGGFGVTTATLTAQVGPNVFRISRPLYFDYLMAQQAVARLAFPVVGGWQVKHAAVEGLTIEGNRAKAEPLDGCRGGGIYLFECEDMAIRNCTVRGYNGDGISFQVSQGVTVEGCQLEDNAGHGLHPGSGSQRPVVRHNRSTGNGRDGLFVCWRVRHGLFEDNTLQGNRQSGVCIGHKDSDNLFRGNRILGNDDAGITFRNETEPMGAHRNRFEKNVVLDNGGSESAAAAVVIRGEHHDLVFRENVIGFSQPRPGPTVGIRAAATAKGLSADENDFRNVATPVAVEAKRER